jgi:crossover junction endodeoxyribonuclease RusA
MTNITMDIFVPMEPDKALGPNGRMHWRARAALIADTRAAAKYATINALHQSGVVFPKEYPVQVDPVIHWAKGRKLMDEDNSLAILKSFFDGIADAIEVDDRLFRPTIPDQVRKAPVPGVVFSLRSLYPSQE